MTKELITFDLFSKIEIKVGKIEVAEPIKDSNKLLRLEIDFGDFKRQVVAGIGDVYSCEQLVDMVVPVLLNLEPRTLFGYESQGMILAVGNKQVSALLTTDKDVSLGEDVH